MNRFMSRDFVNVEGELDLWIRNERACGSTDTEILQDLSLSIEGLLAAHREDLFDDIPEQTMTAYDEGYQDGKHFERSRLSPAKPQPHAMR